MEKKPAEQIKLTKQSSESTNHEIWDCGSSLYDSFELKAFQKQLDSAISSRTLSTPHLSDPCLPPSPLPEKKPATKKSRSFHKLIRAVFCFKCICMTETDAIVGGGRYVVNGRPPALPRIPEVGEFNGLSPGIRSSVRRTASERSTTPANSAEPRDPTESSMELH